MVMSAIIAVKTGVPRLSVEFTAYDSKIVPLPRNAIIAFALSIVNGVTNNAPRITFFASIFRSRYNGAKRNAVVWMVKAMKINR